MRRKDGLFKLIKTLNKGEKKAVRLLLKKYGDTNHLITLWDATKKQLLKQPLKYDEKELKKELKDSPILSYFEVNKNRLYYETLKALQHSNLEKSLSIDLHQQLDFVELLFAKKQYSKCQTLINAIKKKAYAHEKFQQILMALQWELLLVYENKIVNKSGKDVLTEEKKVTEIILNLNAYRLLGSEVNKLYDDPEKNKKSIKKEVEILNKNPLLSSPDKAFSIKARDHYYNFKATICFSKALYEEAMFYLVENIKNLESSKSSSLINSRGYIRNIGNIIEILSITKKEDITPWIKKMEELKLKITSRIQRLFITSQIIDYKLTFVITQIIKDCSVDNLIEEAEAFLVENKEDVVLYYLYNIEIKLAVLYHRQQNYKLAIQKCLLLQSQEINAFPTIYYTAFLVQVVALIDVKKYDVAFSKIKALHRLLPKNKRTVFENFIYMFTSIFSRKKAYIPSEITKEYSLLLKKEAFAAEHFNPFFDLNEWLLKKVENKH